MFYYNFKFVSIYAEQTHVRNPRNVVCYFSCEIVKSKRRVFSCDRPPIQRPAVVGKANNAPVRPNVVLRRKHGSLCDSNGENHTNVKTWKGNHRDI